MSEVVKTRSLVLRPHEARRLAEHGSVMVVRVVKWPRLPTWCDPSHEHDVLINGYPYQRRYDVAGLASETPVACPFGRVGDEFWCREAWAKAGEVGDFVEYRADNHDPLGAKWRSAATMPRGLSRFTVVVEGVQCKPVRDVTEEEAIATGIERDGEGRWKHYCKPKFGPSPIHSFETLQRKLYGPDAWASNVFCWFATMRRIEL